MSLLADVAAIHRTRREAPFDLWGGDEHGGAGGGGRLNGIGAEDAASAPVLALSALIV
jgi:hypothetical protein